MLPPCMAPLGHPCQLQPATTSFLPCRGRARARFTLCCAACSLLSPRSCLSHRKLRDRWQLMSTKAHVSKKSIVHTVTARGADRRRGATDTLGSFRGLFLGLGGGSEYAFLFLLLQLLAHGQCVGCLPLSLVTLTNLQICQHLSSDTKAACGRKRPQ